MPNHTPSPRLPGTWLLFIAGIVFNESVLRSVAHQTIADFRDEWLRAGSDRARRLLARYRGYVAFWSLVLLSPIAFRNWPEGPTRETQRRTYMTSASRVRLALILLVAGLVSGNVVSRLRPVLYQSTTVLQVTPAKAPGALQFDAVRRGSEDLYERLQAVKLVVHSRTSLEFFAKALELGKTAVVPSSLLSQLRERTEIKIENAAAGAYLITVNALDPDPRTAQRIAEKLSAAFIDRAVNDHKATSEVTLRFYERQVERAGAELALLSDQLSDRRGDSSLPRRMEVEAMQTSYKDLLARRENARMISDFLQGQGGEQFTLVEPAMLPDHPAGPTRLECTLFGGFTGLATALIAAFVLFLVGLGRARRVLAMGR